MNRRIAEVLAGLACICVLADASSAQVTLAALRGKVTRSRAPYERFEAVTVPALLR